MNKGFTMIEMLIVLGVIGVATTFGLINFRSYLLANQNRQTIEELSRILKEVREKAITTSQGYKVTVTTGASAKYVTWQATDVADTPKTVTLPYGNISSFDDTDGKIDFTGRGLPDKQYVIETTYGGKVRKLVLLPTGKVVIP